MSVNLNTFFFSDKNKDLSKSNLTGLTSSQLERAVQYMYRLYQAKRDGTLYETAPSRDILLCRTDRLGKKDNTENK